MILVFTRQLEVSVRVANFIQEQTGWKALACAPRPTIDSFLWHYHADTVTGGGDTIVYGWTLLNVLAEGGTELPPNYIRWWCREFMVRGGVVLHIEPYLDEDASGIPQETVQAEMEARQHYQKFLNEGIHGLPATIALSMDSDELKGKIVEADAFLRLARRYEAEGFRRFGYGSLAPRILFVGDEPCSMRTGKSPFSGLEENSSGVRLAKILDRASLDEGELHFLSIKDGMGNSPDAKIIKFLRPETVVLMGKDAELWYQWLELTVSAVLFDESEQIKSIECLAPGSVEQFAQNLKQGIEMTRSGSTMVDARWRTVEADNGGLERSGEDHNE